VRVAVVSPYDLDVAGGVQAHVHSLAAALRRGGDDVLVLGPGKDREVAHRIALGRSLAVPANGSRAPLAFDPRAVSRLRAALRRIQPDVVHVHEPLVPLIGPAAAVLDGFPRVLTFHATAEGGLLPQLYRGLRAPARWIIARADRLTAVSPVAAAFHARMLGIDAARITIVPNGVDVARFSAAAGERSPVPRVVFLGRLEHRKGADTALRAFLQLAAQRPDLRMRILGGGPLAGAIERLRAAAPADIAARVELMGRIDPRDLPRLLADADVAVLPARGGESFGIVLLEAMAAGVPIVATDIPGYRAVARDGREALLVPPDDPSALARAVGRILDDQTLATGLRTAGRARARDHDWGAVASRMRDVYVQATRHRG
jgi:phosphatidyl-myo-inositol alpha-mannosyltransferase